MAEYTNPNHTSGATLTTGELVGSTIANIDTTGENAYARVLTLKTDASASDLTITTVAAVYVSANAVVDGVTLSSSTTIKGTPRLRVSNGGTARNVVTNGTVELWPYGGKVENVTANTGCYLTVISNGEVDGGSFNGKQLAVGSTTGNLGGTIRNLVIKKTAEDSVSNCLRETGSMFDCTISKGAVYRVSGGLAERTIVSGAGARFIISKGTANSTMLYAAGSGYVIDGTINETIVSGGTLFVSGGTVDKTKLYAGSAIVSDGTVTDTIASGGTMTVLNGTVDDVEVLDGGRLIVSSGATVTGVAESGGYVSVAAGAEVTFVETDLTNYTFTQNATVHESTLAKDVTVASGATLVVCADSTTSITHGTVDGVTVKSGGSITLDEGKWNWGSANWATISSATVEEGGLIRLKNFVQVLNVSAGEGAYITRESNRTGIGGANTNIAKGVIVDYSTKAINEFGDDFQVVNGTATGLYLTGDGTTGRSAGDFLTGLTIKDGTVANGASAYFYDGVTIDGLDVYGVKAGTTSGAIAWMGAVTGGNVRIGSGGSLTINSTGAALDGVDVFSGGAMTVNYAGSVNNLTVSSGGVATISRGAHGSATVGLSGTLNFNGGTAEKLTVDGTGSTTTVLNINGGTVDVVNVKSGGLTIAGANTVVESLEVDGANKIWVKSGATINGGRTKGSYELRFEAGGGTIKDFSVGNDTYVYMSAGSANNVTFASNAGKLRFWGSSLDALTLENCTIYRKKDASDNRGLVRGRMIDCTLGSGGYLAMSGGENTGMKVAGTLDMTGGVLSNAQVQSGGALLLSGGTVRDIALSGYTATATIYDGGTISGAVIEDAAVVQVNAGAALYDPILRQNEPAQVISGATRYARINVGYTGIDGGLVSGGTIAGNGNTIEFYMWSGAVASDVTFKRGTWAGAYSGALISGGTFEAGTLIVRGGEVRGIELTGGTLRFDTQGGTANGNTVRGAGVLQVSKANTVVQNNTILSGGQLTVSGAEVAGTIVSDGGKATVYSGGTMTNTTISSGGYLLAGGNASQGKVNGLTVLSGGSLWLTANSASVTGFAAEAGAVISLSLTNAGATTNAAFDTLADCDATIELLNVGTATKTFNIATTGNTNQQFAMVGSSVFEGAFKAGDVYVDPFTQQQLTVAADATTVDVVQYNRTTTNEAVGFATSGSVINGGDKELMWDGATVTGAVKLIDADAAAAITGDAWMDIRACAAGSGAAIYGTDLNVNFNGKVQYQLHGTGDTVGNFAGGANYGGSVKGVDMLSYNTTYTGVGYAGGFGTVQNEVEVVFAGGNNLNKDFYMGSLYNAGKVTGTTGVGNIKATIGEKTADEISVKGNVYGASAVKAGTISTSPATPLHTVGDVSLTLRAGNLTDGKCVFAGGYATGHDTAKTAAVYTVESVDVDVVGGSWGLAHGGRGVFGGAFASDNIVDGEEAAGVWAQVGDVNMTISAGTMGNVYGGGWAQKNAKSEVGNVNLTITGGTMANVFGGGSHSTSGGTTVAGTVTITVSGGTISGDIYARGQLDGDITGSASVIFTGSKAFGCAVYGYSYVGGAVGGAALSFSDYTGTFSGAIGGFDSITLDGNTKATFAAPAEGTQTVTNTAWTFDTTERAAGMTGTAFLNWTAADFADDTIALNLASGDAVAWDLVSAASATVYNKFDVLVDGTSILSETIDLDEAISGGAYDGWGFTVEGDTLKFKHLA